MDEDVFGRRRPKTRRASQAGKEVALKGPKGGKLPSLMAHMINRPAAFAVIFFSALLVTAGCSTPFQQEPRERANEIIGEANEAIARHNQLFEEARSTYDEVRERIESGGDVEGSADRISEARDTLQDARNNLEEAQTALQRVQELEVEEPVREYASTLSEAMDAQLEAEAREIEFYELLEQDPTLEENRDEALELLSEVGEGYQTAEERYQRARELADQNQEIISPGDAQNGQNGGEDTETEN